MITTAAIVAPPVPASQAPPTARIALAISTRSPRNNLLAGVARRVALRALRADQPPDAEADHQEDPVPATPARSETPRARGSTHRHHQQHDVGEGQTALGQVALALWVAVGGHEQHGGEVEERAGASEEGQRDRRDPEQDRVDVEVAAEAGADARDHAVVAAAEQPARSGPAARVGCSSGWSPGGTLTVLLFVHAIPVLAQFGCMDRVAAGAAPTIGNCP